MLNRSKAYIEAAKQLPSYLAEHVMFTITYKQGGSNLVAYSEEKCGNNPDNSKSTLFLHIVMLANSPINFKVGFQSLTAQYVVEAEIMAAGRLP